MNFRTTTPTCPDCGAPLQPARRRQEETYAPEVPTSIRTQIRRLDKRRQTAATADGTGSGPGYAPPQPASMAEQIRRLAERRRGEKR